MVLVLLWIFFAFILALYAKINGRSFIWWLILGLVIDPILAWILYKVVAD